MKTIFNNIGKYTLAALLTFVLALPTSLFTFPQSAQASEANAIAQDQEGSSDTPSDETNPELVSTQVTGLVTEKAVHPTSNPTNTIIVSPAYGRTVYLQRKIASEKWKTVSTFTTNNKLSAKVKLSYPASEWKTRTFTTWRVYIPQTEVAQDYLSEEVLLYTKNRTTIPLNAKSAVVMNASTGRVLYSKNQNVRRDHASITKIMTGILAIEKNKLSKKVRIMRSAARTPWTYIPISTGNKVTIKNLLYAALLPSSNGAATALGQATSGTTSRFINLMNKKAKELGMNNTNYRNAHGLTQKNHYSSAYDTAVLLSYAMKNNTFKKIVNTSKFTFVNSSARKRCRIENTNRLLRQGFKGVIGGKTGFTDEAGYCFACAYQGNSQTYVVVVLGCNQAEKSYTDTKKLINYIKKYGW